MAAETSKRLLPLSGRKVMGLDQLIEAEEKARETTEATASALMWG